MRNLHTLTIGICLLLFFFAFIPTSYAEEGQTYEVGISSLNTRSAPSHSGDIVGLLGQGDKIIAFNKTHGWIQTYYGGQEAWVASQFLIPVQDEIQVNNNKEQSEQEMIKVNTNNVQIRSGAGTNYDVIGVAKPEDTYDLLETSGDWHQVSLSDGVTGWIAAWLTNTPTATDEKEEAPEDTNSADEVKIKPKKQSANGSLEGINIVLDPGHGGKDPGSIGLDGVQEKDLIMTTTDKVARQLRDAGANVTLTRTGDYFVSLEERVRISHADNTDAFISLHYNAFPVITVQGIHTYYDSDGVNRELAQALQSSLAQNVAMQDRGINQADFHVLRENSNPSTLIELGFITNPDDIVAIQSADYQDTVANGITNGLKDYFNN